MSSYVIRNEFCMYVAPSGSVKSYVRQVLKARRFPTREAAEQECCGNERVIPLRDIIGDLPPTLGCAQPGIGHQHRRIL